jgi:Ssp1 endopeptidase immunity protein Rap1a
MQLLLEETDDLTDSQRVYKSVKIEKRDKMKNISLIALVVLFSFSAFGVNDETPDKLNGTELATACQESTQGFDAGYCLGVVEGVLSTSKKVCNPAITLGDAVTVVNKYIKDNPDKLNKRDAELVREALSKTYPCSFFKR